VQGFCSKVATLPHVPAAVVVSGPPRLVPLLGDLLWARTDDLDELVGSLGDIAAMLSSLPVPVRVVIAGHSKRHGPAAWHLVGDRFESFGGKAFYASPAIDGFTPARDADPAAFEASMVELVELQRSHGYPVAGHAMLTSITLDGITQRIIHRWPDRIGDVVGRSHGH
jgi:hypothetical protein